MTMIKHKLFCFPNFMTVFVIREADTGVLILAGSSHWWSRIKQAPRGGGGKSGFFTGIYDLVMLVCKTILDIIISVQFS